MKKSDVVNVTYFGSFFAVFFYFNFILWEIECLWGAKKEGEGERKHKQ